MIEVKERLKKDKKKSFTACVRVKGFKTVSKTFPTKSKALDWAKLTQAQLKSGAYTYESKTTLSDVIKLYIETELPNRKSDHEKTKMQLMWWDNEIGGFQIDKITVGHLVDCKNKLLTEPSPKPKNGRTTRTGATVNRYLYALSAVLTKASGEWEMIPNNPMRKLSKCKETAKQERYLETDEIKALLNACKTFEMRGESYNYETFLFASLALTTSARYSELLNLKWEHIDFKNDQIIFLETKNGEDRYVPLTADLKEELQKFKKTKQFSGNYLWINKTGRNLINMRSRFEKALELSGIPKCRIHDLRHTCASHMAMNGASALEIAEVTGHKSMQMTKRYTHFAKAHTKKMMANVTAKMFQDFNNQ